MSKIFAYGSLLNKNTWSFEADIELVCLKGWIRQWRQIIQTDKGKICALSISPNLSTSIEGILLNVDQSALLAINERETGYDKTLLEYENFKAQRTNIQLSGKSIITYTGSSETTAWANQKAPILLSYIDVVAKGYFDVFGWEGVNNFFESTQGWQLPILDDRKTPIYPRAQELDKKFLNQIDQQLLLRSKDQQNEED